ncbi:MAG: glycosyltransferase [Chitinophagaceae bacterium]
MKRIFPEISVVIPVRNESAKIRACIDGILSQTVPVKEIIVVDSGSTDGTIEILKSYPIVKLVEIQPSEFNHGETRNFGVSKASGEFVLLTVGDARAFDNKWIEYLLEGFDEATVAGVCGQQVVAHDRETNPVEWFRPSGAATKKKFVFTKEEFTSLNPAAKKEACGWDDVTAMYRTEVLKKIPFRRTSYSEDALWAKDALMAGHTIVYNTAARVYHYHNEDRDFSFKRAFTTMYMRYKYLDYVTGPPKRNLRGTLSIVKTILKSNPLTSKEKWYWLKYNLDQFKAIKEAQKEFENALSQGEKKLEITHEKWCGKPPIPLKKNIVRNEQPVS